MNKRLLKIVGILGVLIFGMLSSLSIYSPVQDAPGSGSNVFISKSEILAQKAIPVSALSVEPINFNVNHAFKNHHFAAILISDGLKLKGNYSTKALKSSQHLAHYTSHDLIYPFHAFW